MTLFVDTSGILALVDRDDPAHPGVVESFTLGRSEPLATQTERRNGLTSSPITLAATYRFSGRVRA